MIPTEGLTHARLMETVGRVVHYLDECGVKLTDEQVSGLQYVVSYELQEFCVDPVRPGNPVESTMIPTDEDWANCAAVSVIDTRTGEVVAVFEHGDGHPRNAASNYCVRRNGEAREVDGDYSAPFQQRIGRLSRLGGS